MMYPVDTLVKADAIVISTNMLLKAVMVCDSFDNVGIPALLTYTVIENNPETKYRLCDEFKVLVPAEYYDQASEMLDANPIWA
jgi:hypothetical protein